jgi:hypothetical protein
MLYIRKCRRGLDRKINQLAKELAESRFEGGLFPDLEDTCRAIEHDRETLRSMRDTAETLRHSIATLTPGTLGSKTPAAK